MELWQQEKNYIPIIQEGDTQYYGGSQYWYPKFFHRQNSCGPVAAANTVACLSNRQLCDQLSQFPCAAAAYTKDAFVKRMIEARKFVRPGLMGLTSIEQYGRQTADYAKSTGLKLIPVYGDQFDSVEEAWSFIENGLSSGCPVSFLLLMHKSTAFKDFLWHWMIITHLMKDPATDRSQIVISTWGERHVLDLHDLWTNQGKKGNIRFVYFTVDADGQ